MRKCLYLLPVLILLSACSDSPKLRHHTMDGLTYTFDGSGGQLDKITKRASEECAKQGRIAVLRNTSEIDDGYIANFSCARSAQN